jgi:hypothetical protein
MAHAQKTSAPPSAAPAETRRVVTGNRLRDGVPVYFAGNGRWSSAVAEARHVAAEAADALLTEAQAGLPPHPVVAPYLIDASLRDGHPHPLGLREEIRAFGPTVRPEPAL